MMLVGGNLKKFCPTCFVAQCISEDSQSAQSGHHIDLIFFFKILLPTCNWAIPHI